MNYLGRRIYYDKSTGQVLLDTGEKEGDVNSLTIDDDFINQPMLTNRNSNNTGVIEFEYGEKNSDFSNIGSMIVNLTNNELIIYPRLSISSDITQINNDGIEIATITVNLPESVNEEVTFKVNNEGNYIVNSVNGIATFQFTSTVLGTFSISAHSNKYGTNVVNIEVI